MRIWECQSAVGICSLERVVTHKTCQLVIRVHHIMQSILTRSFISQEQSVKKVIFGGVKKVKAKASHTQYRALGPELIQVYRQSGDYKSFTRR